MRDDTPVLIGGGQFTYRGAADTSPSPLDLLKVAAERAAVDAGLDPSTLSQLDGVAIVGFTIDAPGGFQNLPFPRLKNPPASFARAVGAQPSWEIYSHMGGNSPQQLINTACERIARGENDLVLAAGAEFLGSLMKRLKGGAGFAGWDDPYAIEAEPKRMGDPRPGTTDYENAHGLNRPINVYPMFENALRARDGRSIPDHQKRLGKLFAPFTRVAAANPHAWFPTERSETELIEVTGQNRWVSFPYPKYLNAIMEVDQSAGVLIASVKKARELGVPEDKWVFLHGCADASDLWHPIDRQNFHSSPAMELTGKRAFEMARIGPADLDFIDLYSCFPIAVEVGAEALGLSLDDPRGLTVTGGLPYFGGPGNNYAMHSVVTMLDKLRHKPGGWGLCTANGWYLTKQSTGIYSTTPVEGVWEREDPAVIQRQIDALPHPAIEEHPQGPATVETYTIVHTRDGYHMGIIVGRDSHDNRFMAVLPEDEATLKSFEEREGVGRTGTVSRHPDGKRNLFTPD